MNKEQKLFGEKSISKKRLSVYFTGKKEENQLHKFPQKLKKREMFDIKLKKKVTREAPQCCAAIEDTDPPVRCENFALKGLEYCRPHNQVMIKEYQRQSIRKYSDTELKEQLEKLRRSDLLDIQDEIALTVIVLKKYVEGYVANAADLDSKDVKSFLDLIESITRNTERLHKMKYGENLITEEKLNEILLERSQKEIQIIDTIVQDNELRTKLLEEFSNL